MVILVVEEKKERGPYDLSMTRKERGLRKRLLLLLLLLDIRTGIDDQGRNADASSRNIIVQQQGTRSVKIFTRLFLLSNKSLLLVPLLIFG